MNQHERLSRFWPVGSRVELHPATSRWMRGDRFGTVERIGKRNHRVYVRLDKSDRLVGFHESNITRI